MELSQISTDTSYVMNFLTFGGIISEISDTCGRRFIQKIHWEFVQGEFKPFSLVLTRVVLNANPMCYTSKVIIFHEHFTGDIDF